MRLHFLLSLLFPILQGEILIPRNWTKTNIYTHLYFLLSDQLTKWSPCYMWSCVKIYFLLISEPPALRSVDHNKKVLIACNHVCENIHICSVPCYLFPHLLQNLLLSWLNRVLIACNHVRRYCMQSCTVGIAWNHVCRYYMHVGIACNHCRYCMQSCM